MRTLLEMLRIILLMIILVALGGIILNGIYSISNGAAQYTWIGGLAVLVLYFVLYRNKLQFSGWYKGEERKKLSKSVSFILVAFSSILLISPFILSNVLG